MRAALPGRLIDLSHEIRDDVVTYPGFPPPVVTPFLSRADSRSRYAEGTEFFVGRIDLVANTGTYVDAPYHRHAEGADVGQLPLADLADLPGTLIDARAAGRSLGPELLDGHDLRGRAVLVLTGWDRHWGTDRYFHGHPFLTEATAEALVAGGARLVGIDSLNIDDTEDGRRPVHSRLLARGRPVVEHLRGLERLPREGFRFFAVPAPVRGLGSFPVRAFAVLD